MKRNLYSICIGLVVGTILPIVLFLALVGVDIVVINVAYTRFSTSIGWPVSQLYILLIPTEVISFFFLARLNRILTAAALFTAIISTAYVIYVAISLKNFAPN